MPGTYIPALDVAIENRRIIARTAKGYRLSCLGDPNDIIGSFFSTKDYLFFETRLEVLEYLADFAEKVVAVNQEAQLSALHCLCDFLNAIRAEQKR